MIPESALNLEPDSTERLQARADAQAGANLQAEVSVQVDPESASELQALFSEHFCASPQEGQTQKQALAEFCSSCEQFLRQILAELPQELQALQAQAQEQEQAQAQAKAQLWLQQLEPKILQDLCQSHFWQNWQLNLLLCSDRRMSVWNLQFRGIDGPTDILSFPLAALDALDALDASEPSDALAALAAWPSSTFLKETGELAEKNLDSSERGGDLLLSLHSWLSNCRDFACEAEAELQRLLLHGVLHLAGLDHAEDENVGGAENIGEVEDFEELGPMLQLQEHLLRHSLERRKILKQ